MVIYCDTRQKRGHHDLKEQQMIEKGYTLEQKQLPWGDYMLEGNTSISVDTKQNCQELYLDLMGEHPRFRREIVRAFRNDCKLVILIEDDEVKNLQELKTWVSKRGLANGSVLYDKATKLHYAYGVEFMFCKPAETGYKIVELLTNC